MIFLSCLNINKYIYFRFMYNFILKNLNWLIFVSGNLENMLIDENYKKIILTTILLVCFLEFSFAARSKRQSKV